MAGGAASVWSLLEMLRHYAGNWLVTVCSLERLRWLAFLSPQSEIALEEFDRRRLDALQWMPQELSALPFSESIRRQFDRMMEKLRSSEPSTQVEAMAILTLLDELKLNIQSELETHLFFVVPAQRKGWYQNGDAALFGQDVACAFPDSSADLAEAGRCFALARWTACVFHLMRAVELALHRWARELGVDNFSALELENWKTILDAAKRKIEALERQPKSPKKDADLKYYGETRTHFLSMKDAWRNHVAHAKERYDQQRAHMILLQVREFMVLLATRSEVS